MINFNKRIISIFFILFLLIILFFCGSFILYSATYKIDQSFSPYFLKQVFGFITGGLITIFLARISYKKMIIWGGLFHFTVLLLLIFTLIKGSSAMGGRRWINLLFFKFQPSELAKISVPVSLLYYLFYYCIPGNITLYNWAIMILNIFGTGLLIIKQPDLGTALIIIIANLAILFIMGLPKKIIYTGILFFCISCPILWDNLHEYQKKRIFVFLGYGSVHKERYQLEQSKIAVGSGGLYGKGFLKGTQKNLHFLPENRTDFIFAVLAEEFGFIGVFFIIFIYTILFFFFFLQSKRIRDEYGYLLYQAMLFPFMLGIIFNIGMIIGLFPVVGIPLPCMSYGITHIWSTAILFGIAISVLYHKEEL
jgi:rod shape determining protein RodA